MKELPSSYGEIIKIINDEGAMSFIFERRHKRIFYHCIQRLNKLEKHFRKKRIMLNVLITYIYGIYVGALQMLLTFNNKDLDNAVTIYQVACRYIASFEGKDLPNDKVEIIYHGRT